MVLQSSMSKSKNMNKTERAMELLAEGKFEKALGIIAGFRHGFSKEEKRILKIAHECLSGNSKFYDSIGVVSSLYISKAREIVRNKYNVN